MQKIAENRLPTRRMMFCTDDKHLEDIRHEGHINYILRRAVANGIPAMQAIQMALDEIRESRMRFRAVSAEQVQNQRAKIEPEPVKEQEG